jgi:hypothetical protein
MLVLDVPYLPVSVVCPLAQLCRVKRKSSLDILAPPPPPIQEYSWSVHMLDKTELAFVFSHLSVVHENL